MKFLTNVLLLSFFTFLVPSYGEIKEKPTYSIQIKAPTEENIALALKDQLKSLNLPSFIQKKEIDDQIYYRVRIGVFESKDLARTFLEFLNSPEAVVLDVPSEYEAKANISFKNFAKDALVMENSSDLKHESDLRVISDVFVSEFTLGGQYWSELNYLPINVSCHPISITFGIPRITNWSGHQPLKRILFHQNVKTPIILDYNTGIRVSNDRVLLGVPVAINPSQDPNSDKNENLDLFSSKNNLDKQAVEDNLVIYGDALTEERLTLLHSMDLESGIITPTNQLGFDYFSNENKTVSYNGYLEPAKNYDFGNYKEQKLWSGKVNSISHKKVNLYIKPSESIDHKIKLAILYF